MALIQGQFFSKKLKRLVSYSALIPVDVPDYLLKEGEDLLAQSPFKTLYLLHGYSGNQQDWLTGSRIQDLAMRHRLAVIMPNGENSFYLDQVDREQHYGEFIGQELPEVMGRLFNLSSAREDRYIAGLSMGGFGALRNGLKYNETFSAIMALSSALITNRISTLEPGYKDGIASYEYYQSTFGPLKQLVETDNHPDYIVSQLKKDNKQFPRIYIACGTEDFLIEDNRHFHEFLKREEVAHEYVEGPGIHDWLFWDAYIEKALDWLES